MREAVVELGDGAAERVDLGGQRGEPVGLVAAQVADAGDSARAVGEGGERDERRGELAAVAEVEVDAADAVAAAAGPPSTVSASPSRLTVAPKWGSSSASSAPTCVVDSGQPSIVTVPPATSAAARNGAAFDRSGSMSTSRAAIGPGGRRSSVRARASRP